MREEAKSELFIRMYQQNFILENNTLKYFVSYITILGIIFFSYGISLRYFYHNHYLIFSATVLVQILLCATILMIISKGFTDRKRQIHIYNLCKSIGAQELYGIDLKVKKWYSFLPDYSIILTITSIIILAGFPIAISAAELNIVDSPNGCIFFLSFAAIISYFINCFNRYKKIIKEE